MNIRSAVTAVVLIAGSAPVAAHAESLLAVIPEDVRAVVWVNDIHRAHDHFSAANVALPSDGWPAAFAVDTKMVLGAVSGPLVRAEFKVGEKSFAHVVVAKVADVEKVELLLRDSQNRLNTMGARVRQIDEGRAKGVVAERRAGDTVKQYVVLNYSQHVVFASRIELAQRIIRMIALRPPESVEALASQRAIRAKLTPAADTEPLRLDWFVNPWAGVQPDKQAIKHGLTGIQAFGGAVMMDADGSLATETMVYAPGPLSGSLQMLDLTPAEAVDFPDWVSSDVVQRAALLHANVPAALERMGPAFDDLFAEGADGTYEDVLEDLKDPDGLNVDLRREMFPLLGPRVVIVHDRAASETDKAGPPALVAFETREPAKVARVLDILMEGDRQASRVEIAGAQVWQVASEGDAPDSATTVTRGYAIYTNNVGLLRQLLTAAADTSLERQAGFAAAKQAILARRSRDVCAVVGRSLSRGDAVTGAKWLTPVDGVFAESWTGAFAAVDEVPVVSWWTFDRLPFLESSGVALGYLEKDGWLFLSQKQ